MDCGPSHHPRPRPCQQAVPRRVQSESRRPNRDHAQRRLVGTVGPEPREWVGVLSAAYPSDVLAAQTKMDFALGWFADPIYLGRYPQSMIDRLGDRLPRFTPEEIKLVHGSSEVRPLQTFYRVRLMTVLRLQRKLFPLPPTPQSLTSRHTPPTR